MRLLLVIALAVVVVFAAVGCSEKKVEMTKATQVENPKETPAKSNAPVPKAEAAKPKVEEAKAEAPKPGKDGWVTLPSGLKYKDKKVGTGAVVKSGDYVTVNYKGWLDNGTVFDTSKKPGREPLQFTVDKDSLIQGWHEGIKGMKPGGTRELNIPYQLGYGEAGDGRGVIPPKARLHFDIDLLKIGQ